MIFLHSEFLGWLLLPTLILFYFWLTQKPLQNRWLSEEALEKLRAPELTMGLGGRNLLFLISALLLIVAMAQPVILDSTPIQGKKLFITMAIDRGGEFNKTRLLAPSTLSSLVGEEIELIAFDDHVYQIAPRSNDEGILYELISYLSPSSKLTNLSLLEAKLLQSDADLKVVITSKFVENKHFLSVASSADILNVHEKLMELRTKNNLKVHTPLFFYPLGLAMLLILFALSSMSKRQSVSVSMVLLTMSLTPQRSDAWILDFQLLSEAKEAYEKGAYEKSERLYGEYQLKHDSPQVRYNRANALYMSGKYERAHYWYERVHARDPMLVQRTHHNLQQSVIKMKKDVQQKNDASQVKNSIQKTTINRLLQKKELQRSTQLFAW